ncbi:Zinc transporter, ZIP family [Candidatus Syntrophocurvum alkaliphilum]|uniref:Zinc transporter, ZIP family n=1 Tax=Candidatus Syntrophocurvum alkaliphilum TaxID=2293317 RepID=A0A6I6DFV4_9FIRM|nr:ZIP family metal transporter [Candidatus Syntrophocurvum alkaliphilum]QGT99261.1 Zinc transporter, ZIP family [Candidatus Syntrophocurvum alkaliphilum]
MLSNSLFISFLAGFCTTLGAVLLFLQRKWSNKNLAFFLGLAAGVMIAVVIFDLLPSALFSPNYKSAILGILVGVILLGIIDKIFFKRFTKDDSLLGLGYLIMLGIALHDLPEGMAIALGDEMHSRAGMVIALGIGIHNIPEGMAIAAPLLMVGMSKFSILVKTFLVGLITPLGYIIGKLAITVVPNLLPLLLGFASGVMLYLVIFQLWPEAKQKNQTTRWWGLWLGILIILIATYI